ncbi:hypothetical protein EG329_006633 [Mollisiaceae sp. DMI_Dod_QoI]|nr:hypothetical protein EG329_006633 [Helotiales sp. DMI_Dod_QoI]
MEAGNYRSYDRATDTEKYNFPTELPNRPTLSTAGKQITVRVNQFKVLQWPQRDVYQYDILIGNGAEKRGKIMAVWKSKTVQAKLASFNVPWLWDGNKIAWTSAQVPEQRIKIDFDAEKGRQPRDDPDVVYCVIKPSKVVRMAVIQGYLSRQMPFDNAILEAINFLDHLMRQGPSEAYTLIKRSFFARGGATVSLDNCVVAMKGVYSSIRLCNPKSSVGAVSTGLAINVDVANGTFWASQDVHQAARNYLKDRNRTGNWDTFRNILRPVKDAKVGWTMSDDFKTLRKMCKLKFTVKHRGKQDDGKLYSIKKFTFEPKDGGSHAKNTFFKLKNRTTNTEEDISVYDYFRRTYNISIQMWDLPLIVTDRAGMFPMELCTLAPNQRYNFKLSPEQTAAMIKFAVTRPKERIASIRHGIGMLKWNQDRYLNHYGVKIDDNMTQTQARLLPNPEIQFLGSKVNPGTSGRWDLRGKKFFLPNDEPLNSWGVCVMQECVSEPVVRNFLNAFIQAYTGHGGKVQNRNPVIYRASKTEDTAITVANVRSQAGNQAKALPQILFYVLQGKDSWMYERLKRNTECRFGIVSQCLNMVHVQKAQPQYCSNVCMKVNAKLGGTTSKIVTAKPFFTRPTMIIGADVSHATPGSLQPSMAAITVSFDKECCRYAAAVQTNGYRVEMISPNNIKTMLIPLMKQWVAKLKVGPQHIYYFRDGVSEGQYSHVLNQEVKHMKEAIVEAFGQNGANIQWTVAVCTKRHHIRFFPREGDNQAADRNNNPLPGTLVEQDVTHPFEYDFYLNAHSAIQGTARPVHYHVLLDEAKVPVNDFQKMIYQFSYQYMRSTTPVSLFPAIYYAHLASNRARAHEAKDASLGPQGGQKFEELRQDAAVAAARRGTADGTSQSGSSLPVESIPLLPLGNPDNGANIVRLRCGMWYI